MSVLEQLQTRIKSENLDDIAREFYLSNISNLDNEKQQSILDLVIKMENAGFRNNIPAA